MGEIALSRKEVETATVKIDFWKEYTGEEIADMQGVKPIKDVNDLFGYWPEGSDFNSFYEAAVNSRKHADTK